MCGLWGEACLGLALSFYSFANERGLDGHCRVDTQRVYFFDKLGCLVVVKENLES